MWWKILTAFSGEAKLYLLHGSLCLLHFISGLCIASFLLLLDHPFSALLHLFVCHQQLLFGVALSRSLD